MWKSAWESALNLKPWALWVRCPGCLLGPYPASQFRSVAVLEPFCPQPFLWVSEPVLSKGNEIGNREGVWGQSGVADLWEEGNFCPLREAEQNGAMG